MLDSPRRFLARQATWPSPPSPCRRLLARDRGGAGRPAAAPARRPPSDRHRRREGAGRAGRPLARPRLRLRRADQRLWADRGDRRLRPYPPRPAARPGGAGVGRPLANTRIYLLGPDLQPLRPASVGGLFVAGDGPPRGYRNQPDLTATAFLPDPWSDRPGARITGPATSAVHLPDGMLEFRGRSDDQVKIRGFRIELERSRPPSRATPGCSSRWLVARPTRPGRPPSSPTWWRPAGPLRPEIAELKRFLRESSPPYMVPADFVVPRPAAAHRQRQRWTARRCRPRADPRGPLPRLPRARATTWSSSWPGSGRTSWACRRSACGTTSSSSAALAPRGAAHGPHRQPARPQPAHRDPGAQCHSRTPGRGPAR